MVPGGIHVGSIWLKDGDGLSRTNKGIMEQITTAITQLRGPWILGGDFNMEPKVISDSGWLDTIGGIIVALQLPTCHQHTYDFFSVDKRLKSFILGIQRIEDAGFSLHWPSRLLMKGGARRRLVRQIKKPKVIPAQLPFGPLPMPIEPPDEVIFDDLTLTTLIAWLRSGTGWQGRSGDLYLVLCPTSNSHLSSGRPRLETGLRSTLAAPWLHTFGDKWLRDSLKLPR